MNISVRPSSDFQTRAERCFARTGRGTRHRSSRWTPSSRRLAFIAASAAYIAVLNWSYIAVISPIWSYTGLTYSPPAVFEWLLFSAIALAPALWIPIHLTRPSQWIYLYLYIAVHVPCCIVPLLRSGSSMGLGGPLGPLVWSLLGCMAALGLVYRIPLRAIRPIPVSPTTFWIGMILFLLGSNALLFANYRNILNFVPSLDVRAQRMAGREVLGAMRVPLLSGYSMTLCAYSINPFLMAYGILTRKRWLVVIAITGQCFLYSCAANRAILAIIPLVFLLYYGTRYRRSFGTACMLIITTGTLAGTIVSLKRGTVAIEVTGVLLRTLIAPAHATHMYYDYFLVQPQTNFSHISGLGWLARNPYPDTSLGMVIGAATGHPENNANANLWADGFASAGFFGMAVVTLLAGAAFYAFDAACCGVDLRLALLASCAHGLNLADLPIFTLVLSWGMLFSALLLYAFAEIGR